jgi:dTDP-4-amino-4,6-dideoxygalactose transaminase
MTTLGEGGMLVVKDPALAERLPLLRHNGHCAFDNEQREHYWQPAMSDLDFPFAGMWPSNYCLGEVECALGVKLLDRVDKMNELRRERAIKVIEALSDIQELEFLKVNSSRHVYHLLTAYFNDQGAGYTRDDLMAYLAYSKGIKCVVQYYPLHRYPLYQKAGFGSANCPESERFFDSMISFPFQLSMPETDLDYMIESIKLGCLELKRKAA